MDDCFKRERTMSPDQLLDDVQPWARRLIWLAISLGYDIGLAAAQLPAPTQAEIQASLDRAHATGIAPWIPAAAASPVEVSGILAHVAHGLAPPLLDVETRLAQAAAAAAEQEADEDPL